MSAARILTLRLQRSSPHAERYISYKGNKLELSDTQFSEVISIIPEFWNSERDALTYFALYNDKAYLCNRTKQVYNYSTKESESRAYSFNVATEEQVTELVNKIVNYFNNTKLKEIENLYDTILEKTSDLSYLKSNILYLREQELAITDWMFSRDYTFKSAEEEQEWRDYRQQWRDITESQEWNDNNIMEVLLPKSPQPKSQYTSVSSSIADLIGKTSIPDDIISEMEQSATSGGLSNLIQNYTSVIYKLEILKSVASLNIPLGLNLTEINTIGNILPDDLSKSIQASLAIDETSVTTETYSSFIDNYINILEEKIETINQRLADSNINFTLGELLNKFAEDTKKKIEEAEAEQAAIDLLEEIEFGKA